MKIAVVLGSVILGGLLAAIPMFLNGFTKSSLGEWFLNAFFLIAVLCFIGVKFVLNEPTRSSTAKRKKR